MPSLDDIRKKLPELHGLDDQQALNVIHQVYYPSHDKSAIGSALGVAPVNAGDGSSNIARGFKKAMVQIPETIGGTIGLTGDILGADGMRDYGMGIYEKNKKIEEGLTRDSDSISNVMEGNGSAGDWLASGAGYVGGQALTAIATGGVGGLIGKQIAKRGIAHVIERGAESQIAKQVAENAMSKGVKYGAGATALGSNVVQEAGSIYPEALAQAQEEGRTLDGWDKARVVGSALAAAGVDTAMEGVMVNKVLGGGRRAVKDAAGNTVNESALRAMAREIPAGMAREGVTEGVQTGIERVGAGQDLGSKDAVKDYVDSIALGALGGGLGGAGASFSKQRLPETGALSKAANAGIDAENTLRLENRPDPLVSFRDGTVGRQSELDAHINSLPEHERMAARAQLLGLAPQPLGNQPFTGVNDTIEAARGNNNPLVQQLMSGAAQGQDVHDVGAPQNFNGLLSRTSADNEQSQIDEEQRQAQIEQLRANAEPRIEVPAPTGSFSQVDQTANQIQQEKQQAIANDDAELQAMQDEQDRAQAAKQQEALDAQIADTDARVQAGDAKAIEGRRTKLLDGILSSKIVDGLSAKEISALYQSDLADSGVVNSFMLPHEVEKIQRFDDARAAVLEDSQKADEPVVQARATPNEMPELVRERKELSGPVDGTNFKSVDDAIAAGKTLQVVGGKNVLRKGSGAVFKLNTAQHEYYLSKVPKLAPEVKEAAPAQVLNKSGKPFAEKFAAKMKQKELGNVHDIVPVDGGYALQAKGEAQVQVKSEQGAPVVAESGTAKSKEVVPITSADVQPGDIQNNLGVPFKTKIGAITAQKVHGGTVTPVDGGYVVRPDVVASAESKNEPDQVHTETASNSIVKDGSQAAPVESKAENDRNSITFERATASNDVESITLTKGDFVAVSNISAGAKKGDLGTGEIEGISHAKREVKVSGQWHDVMAVRSAEKPAEIKPKTTPLSSVIDSANAKSGEGLTDADRIVNTLADHQEVMKMARDGTIKVSAFKSAYASVKANESALKEQMASKKKDDLLEAGGGMFAYRNKTEKKDDIINALFNSMLAEFALGKDGGVQYVIGGGMNGYEIAKRKSYDAAVESLTQEDIDSFAAEVKTAREEYVKKVQASKVAIADPKTLNDFTAYMRDKTSGGESVKDAFMSLNADQRAEFDRLAAEKTRAERATRKEEKQEAILRAPGEPVTASEIIKTQHTKHGHDLWQFDLDQRVSREEYDSLLAQAKRLGGSYSSYRRDGAIPGWQFKSEESAKAFKALIAGDTDAAKDVMQNRRDAFADDRSQSASERLNEMAQSLEDNSQESINRDRKTNTSRRAGMASRAESAARSGVAFAKTMRNVAGAIDSGDAKFLDKVREKKQIELMAESVRAAWVDQSRAKGLSYEDIQNGKAAPANRETADFATFPAYTAFRSDLASLARQLLEVDGTKKLGKQLMDVADDVSDTYLAFAKDGGNLRLLMGFSAKGGGIASFSSKPATEAAIARSGYRGKAMPFMVKRGEYTIIYSPSEAISRGVWTGDGDKRITLSRDYGAELVESIGRANRKGNKVSVPWQFESTFDKHKTLARMGIETAAEYRSALREFVGLREQAEAPSKIKELERAMVGRQNDGMDFFPTPAAVADEMIHAADIQPGMKVLEPSAGWGHIAERIREAGVEPDVVELSGSRRELLDAKGFSLVGGDFLEVAQSDVNGGYDRIIMNPPFSDRRDSEHVQHAYSLLKPGGRLVAIMGEGVFFGKDKSALAFRDWIDSVGGTDEKLAAGTFLDSSLPVNTGVNARMVVINKPESAPVFSRTQKNYMFGIPNEILEEEVAAISKNWKNAPKINIVEYANELPFEAPSDARGAYHKGQVYLVASNIRSKEEAQMVLFHEALGHAGLRGALGETLAPALRAIGIQNRSIAEAAAKWRKENADIRGNKTDDQFLTNSIEEALADMAGTGREIKTLEKLLAAVQKALRAIGLDSVANWMEGASNAEALSLLTAARKHIQDGEDTHVFSGEHAQALSRNDESADPIPEDVLKEISSIGDAFRYPKSESNTVEGITKDIDGAITVRKLTNIPGETRYEFTLPDETTARMMVRPFNKYGKSIYGYDLDANNEMSNQVDVRPGKFPEEAHGKGDVWIDVSLLNEGGGYGSKLYHIAANYAHNTDQVFIGDPAGVSHDAMLRRPEQMLSSALKFGTTEHIAPHPRQINGDKKNGIAPLDWIYGDHVGNIKKLIDLNLQNIDNAGGIGGIEYDKQSGEFNDSAGSRIAREDLHGLAKAGLARTASAGGGTLARYAFLKSILPTEGHQKQTGRKPGEFLVRLREQLRDHVSTVDKNGSGAKEVFYSRSGKGSIADAHDILRSASTLGEATSTVKSLLESNSKFNIWDRTVGTQFGKGKKDADFKKVFDASQQQIDDVAHFSIEAERLAPSILRRLDSIKDNVKAVFSNDIEHKANLKAVSQALFDNIEGKQGVQQKVFSNGELRKQFGLNDKQIEMYREARLSVDTSLERLSQSIIASMGQSNGMDIVGLKNASMVDTAKAVQGHLGAGDAHDKVDELLTFTRELQNKGYMPAMRFGEHTVLATDPKTKEVVYFGMHENAIAANIDLMKAKKDFPGMVLEKGRLNKDAFAMFKGVSPETVELFAKFTGTDKNAAVQEYIALAKAGRSSMKRMLERQGIAGFSKDIDRVMASFITSNARQTALNANAYLVTNALSSESLAKKGDVQYEAQELVKYLANPLQEAQKIRGYMFLHFIGGSVASAATNLTQPILQTAPFLHQYAKSKTTEIMLSSAKMAATGRIQNKELADALKVAQADGITDPHEIHNLMADASGSTLGTSPRARASVKLWGAFFSASEAFNRKLTFIASYQTAMSMGEDGLQKAGFKNAYDFAKNAIIETQGLYSKANRPNWARGAVGATLFTFKQFSISYVEFLIRLPRPQKMLALSILVAVAGLQGLPFVDDLEDLIDTIGQSLGYMTNSKKALRDSLRATGRAFLGETAGNILGDVFANGISTQLGVDMSGRLGTGNLLPGTAMFKPSETDKTQDVWEMAGAVGGIAKAFMETVKKVQQGEVWGFEGAVAKASPSAIKNALQGVGMAVSGQYKNSKGKNVESVDLIDSALKSVGFQPAHVAAGSRIRQDQMQDIALVKSVQSNIADNWAHAIANNDQEGIAAARKEMQDWNEINPDSRVKMDMAAIRRRVIEMKKSANDRMLKTAPKSMRTSMREEMK